MPETVDKSYALPVLLRNICLDFGEQQLFSGLDFDFAAGECTCILGTSGCGKSTLLKMIAGIFPLPYSGEISIEKRAAAGDSRNDSLRRYCALMSQNDLLLPWFTALDNVLLGARLRGEITEETRQRGSAILEATGLAASESLLPDALSGGMRQRVALARTLMENRPIMLMDEPFSALDALTRQKMQDLATGLTRGRTVLLVTHDPLEALRLGDTVVVLGGSPSRIIYHTKLQGAIPRAVTDAEVQEVYPRLLSILMQERGEEG